MKVRRYFAANMRSALEMVRQQQGPDVLILSNQKVDNGVELVTADGEVDEALVAKFAEQAKATSRKRSAERRRVEDAAETEAEVKAEAAGAPAARAKPDRSRPVSKPAVVNAQTLTNDNGASLWSDSGTVLQMQRELSSLKGLLEQQLSGLAWSDFGGKHPVRARLLRELSRAGIVPALGRELIEDLADEVGYDEGWRFAVSELQSRLTVLDDPVLKSGGVVTLCGPTGVGKTLVACKLAAQYALAHGADRVAMISTDDQRLGAQQQLKVFGGLLGIAVHSARDNDELDTCLERLEDKDLILIDTAGAPVDDIRLRELVTRLEVPGRVTQNYLVVAASTDYLSLTRVLDAAADLPFDGCIVTKLDEAAVLGPPLSALIEAELPIAYLSAGQQVPDDLEAPIAAQFVDRVLKLADETPIPEDPSVIERAFMN
ncbi:MAG: flagellar biosynthesis protein FlhF [Gammaproteobacteria bacterium]|jgi:flagellar biosynthesis protein FlhF